jgi:UDP-glucose 4-epimerase
MENSKTTKSAAIERVEALVGSKITTCRCNLLNCNELSRVFDEYPITTVIHLAASKGVNVATKTPIECYKNNLSGILNLLEVGIDFRAQNCSKSFHSNNYYRQ